jgi:hypothetical protein
MFNGRTQDLESPEFALLVDCCRQAFPAKKAPDRLPQVRCGVDWEHFLALARRHRVQGLVWRSLHKARDIVPAETAAALAEDARSIAQNGMMEAAECGTLLTAFEAGGVAVLFLKGLPLAQLAYGDPFVKMAWDVDVLVPLEQLLAATDILAQADYEILTPSGRDGPGQLQQWHESRKESVWRKRGANIHVELHTRLADNPRLLPGMTARSPQQRVVIAPGIALPTLATDELFAYLCVHGSSSAWFRLKWLADLAAFLEGCTGTEVTRLYRRAQQFGVARSAGHALLLARDMFSTRLEPALGKELESDRANIWLARLAWRQMTHSVAPTERRLGTSAIHLAQFALRPGIGFKLGELRRQLADALGNRV